MTLEQDMAAAQRATARNGHGTVVRLARRLAGGPQPDVPGQEALPLARKGGRRGANDRGARRTVDAGVRVPDVRPVAPDDEAVALLTGECTSVDGEWGGICPACGKQLPSKPGPLSSSWTNRRLTFSSGSSAGLGERKPYTRSTESIQKALESNRQRRQRKERSEGQWKRRRRSARTAGTSSNGHPWAAGEPAPTETPTPDSD